MVILDENNSAAWDLLHNRVSGFYPVARNFNIAANHNHLVTNCRVDWNALYKACDKETISGNSAQFINVREVA